MSLIEILRRYAGGAPPPSLQHVEDLLRQAKFDGPVTVHYRCGIPRRIEAGKPVTLELSEGDLTGSSGSAHTRA